MPKVNENIYFEVLPTSKVVEYVNDCVWDIADIIDLPPTMTRILLRHFQWDKLILTDKYYSNDDKERFFKEAGIVKLFNDAAAVNQPRETCEICFSKLNLETRVAATNCGHEFCRTCWSEYLTTEIMEGNIVETISCPESDCNIILDDEMVMKLVTNEEVKEKYQSLIANSYVRNNKLLRWCPSPGCSYVIKVNTIPCYPLPIRCTCGHDFCFNCGVESHEIIPCKLFNQFRTFDVNSLQTVEKLCPQCGIMIEKMCGGHIMSCPLCRTKFCWVCLQTLRGYGQAYGPFSHVCQPTEDLEEDRLVLSAVYETLTHFSLNQTHDLPMFINKKSDLGQKIYRIAQSCHDFYTHTNHIQNTELMRVSFEESYNELPKHQKWFSIKQWLAACDTLIECHKTIKNATIFVNFLKKSDKTAIVEGIFEDLKTATEQLGEYTREAATEQLGEYTRDTAAEQFGENARETATDQLDEYARETTTDQCNEYAREKFGEYARETASEKLGEYNCETATEQLGEYNRETASENLGEYNRETATDQLDEYARETATEQFGEYARESASEKLGEYARELAAEQLGEYACDTATDQFNEYARKTTTDQWQEYAREIATEQFGEYARESTSEKFGEYDRETAAEQLGKYARETATDQLDEYARKTTTDQWNEYAREIATEQFGECARETASEKLGECDRETAAEQLGEYARQTGTDQFYEYARETANEQLDQYTRETAAEQLGEYARETATDQLGEFAGETATEQLGEYTHESSTEQLCKYTREITLNDVLSSYRHAQKQRLCLLETIQEGYDNDWWSFQYTN